MVDCNSPGCRKELPPSTLIGTSVRSLTNVISSDCAQNIVYLTDDPGVVTTDLEGVPAFNNATDYVKGDIVEDGGVAYISLVNNNLGNTPNVSPAFWSSAYLNTSTRFQVVGSASQVSEHWAECDSGIYKSAYRDGQQFFQLGSGTGVSPGFYVAAFWDRDNGETIQEALDALYECFQCFCVLVHPVYLSDGNPFYDTPLHKDLEAWASLSENGKKIVANLTFDPAMVASFTENTSQAAQAAALNYETSHYIWAGEQCVDELDGNCEPTGNTINLLNPTHFKYAAYLASFPTTAPTYIPDPFFSGALTGEPVADLNSNETINVTGVDRNQGGQIPDATRYANVYHSVSGYRGFLYGSSVTGFQSYDLMQSKYIKRDLEDQALQVLNSAVNRGISTFGLSFLETRLVSRITSYESQQIITLDEQNFEDQVPDDYVIVQQGPGWVLAREPINNLTLAQLSQGFSPAYFFCYVSLRQLRFIDLTICSLLKPEQITGVI